MCQAGKRVILLEFDPTRFREAVLILRANLTQWQESKLDFSLFVDPAADVQEALGKCHFTKITRSDAARRRCECWSCLLVPLSEVVRREPAGRRAG